MRPFVSGLVAPIDFGNVVSFDVIYKGVHGELARKGDREVVAEGVELAALVDEVVDEFAIFAIFSGENFFKLEDGGIYCDCSVTFEDLGNGRKYCPV